MKTILTLVAKDFKLLLRDKVAILMTFVVPFVLIALMGNIFGNAGNDGGVSMRAKLAVIADNPTDPLAQIVIDSLKAEESLQIIEGTTDEAGETTPYSRESIRQAIEDHHFNFALIIPEDLVKEEGIGLKLELIYNPRNEIESQMVMGLLQKSVFTKLPQLLSQRVDDYSREQLGDENYDKFNNAIAAAVSLAMDLDYETVRPKIGLAQFTERLESEANEEGGDPGSFFGDLLTIEKDQVYGKEIKNPNVTRMIGGYAIMFLLFGTSASAASLFEERNEGLFARLLSMPVDRSHILWSKYLYNVCLGVIQILTLYVASNLLFDVDVFGNFAGLLFVSVAAALACTSFGIFLASISKTAAQAQGLGTFLILIMSSLGGAWWPVEFIRVEFLQILARFTVVYWGVQGFLEAIWEQASILELVPTVGTILLFAVVLNAFSLWRFKTGDLFR